MDVEAAGAAEAAAAGGRGACGGRSAAQCSTDRELRGGAQARACNQPPHHACNQPPHHAWAPRLEHRRAGCRKQGANWRGRRRQGCGGGQKRAAQAADGLLAGCECTLAATHRWCGEDAQRPAATTADLMYAAAWPAAAAAAAAAGAGATGAAAGVAAVVAVIAVVAVVSRARLDLWHACRVLSRLRCAGERTSVCKGSWVFRTQVVSFLRDRMASVGLLFMAVGLSLQPQPTATGLIDRYKLP